MPISALQSLLSSTPWQRAGLGICTSVLSFVTIEFCQWLRYTHLTFINCQWTFGFCLIIRRFNDTVRNIDQWYYRLPYGDTLGIINQYSWVDGEWMTFRDPSELWLIRWSFMSTARWMVYSTESDEYVINRSPGTSYHFRIRKFSAFTVQAEKLIIDVNLQFKLGGYTPIDIYSDKGIEVYTLLLAFSTILLYS